MFVEQRVVNEGVGALFVAGPGADGGVEPNVRVRRAAGRAGAVRMMVAAAIARPGVFSG